MLNQIKNLSPFAKTKPYVVATVDCCRLWYWGAYDTEYEAHKVAVEIDGVIILNENVESEEN